MRNDKRPANPPVGKPFQWKNGPLTGRRIKVTVNWLIGRGWSEEEDCWTTCETDLLPKLTGTIGPLCTLEQANRSIYPLPHPHGLRTNCSTQEYETGRQYLVIWDRRPDEQYPVIDSYYEGELAEFTKPICKVDSWKDLRKNYKGREPKA